MSDTQKRLTELVIEELVTELQKEDMADSVRQMAFEKFVSGQIYQVHIVVTRNEADFLDPFTTEVVEPFHE